MQVDDVRTSMQHPAAFARRTNADARIRQMRTSRCADFLVYWNVMNILIVEPDPLRRADIVDWTCELPGIVVAGAVTGHAEAEVALGCAPIDVIVAGLVPLWDLTALHTAAEQLGITLVEAHSSEADLAELLMGQVASHAGEPLSPVNRLSARTKRLAFERDAQQASTLALAHRLRSTHRRARTNESLELREWLPATIAKLRAVIPEYIELVPIIAAETLPVRCVPDVLEHVVYELVLRAAAQLPWGGTVWLTATPGADGEVQLDVLENGRGRILDLTLRASAPAGS